MSEFDFSEKGFTFGSDDAADAEPKEGTVVDSGASDDSHDSEASILDMLANMYPRPLMHIRLRYLNIPGISARRK